MRIPGSRCRAFLHCPLFSHPKLVTQEKRSTKKRLAPDSLTLILPCPYNTSMGFSLAMFFVKMSRTTARSREVLIVLFSFVVTTPHHRCSVANMAWDPLASVGRMLTIGLEFWLRGANCTNVHLARLIAVQKAGLRCARHIVLASGSADVLGYEVSPANAYCSGTGKRISRVAFSRTDGLFAPSHWRAGDGARQWSRVFLGAQQSYASFKCVRASYLVSGEPWSTVRVEQRALG